MHHHLPGCLAVNPAIDYCACHYRQRHLNAFEIREQIGHFAFRPAPPAHLRNRLRQHRPALPLPAHRHRQLSGMCMANLRAGLRRGLALLAIPAKHLATTVICVARRRSFLALLWVFRTVSVFRDHVFQFRRLPILAISLPHPHGLDYDSKRVIAFNPRDSASNRPQIPSNRPQIAFKLDSN